MATILRSLWISFLAAGVYMVGWKRALIVETACLLGAGLEGRA